jgi:dipeptidyl aminopeptidase/acylaminoacyl peptidase
MPWRALAVASIVLGAATASAEAVSASRFGLGQAYRVWLDGRRVDLSGTRTRGDDTNVRVSPDGRWVSYMEDASLFVVRTDGTRRARLSSGLPNDMSFDGQIAWSPDSRRLVVAATYAPSLLYLVGRGERRRLIARSRIIREPAWSPDGRVIAYRTGDVSHNEVRAVSPQGRAVWRTRGSHFAWSRTDLVAVEVHGRRGSPETVRISDARGTAVRSFPGRSFAWSRDGTRIASVYVNRLEVHSSSGRLLFREAVPGLHRRGSNGVVWVARNRVAIGNVGSPQRLGGAVTVDVRTRAIVRATSQVFGVLSPDRKLVIDVVNVSRGFVLRVSRLDGTNARVLARRVPCPDLLESDVQWLPDGRSLVYDLKCGPARP